MTHKLNRSQRLEAIFNRFGGRAYLGQLIEAIKDDGGLAYRLTNAISELRDELLDRKPMKTIVWTKGDTPSHGLYEILPARFKDGAVVVVKDAQLELV